ncbi:ABC transporter ATP-binding protein [Robertkochia marina]|uniref:ABC transporter ATP-binding protein n=1 Tax=Robertkochia marina TaxID=1227945 RepID=A0A4S3M1W9_9FLAO|nr:ABC transporter ATP-binding protein [Robertkochia marina]THD67465.1 ABC transporter ATP-binding protein [Robertkochia marina]TRZ44666.1 ABC transporter ATP-binding protein [Robertkochia marina]
MTEGYPVLSVKDLLMGYHTSGENIQVSGSVNFDLFPGELAAVVGPNGVGKSTLLRTLAGVHPPLGGDITLNNRSLKSYSAKDLATNLSIVLTEKIPAGNLTAAELIALGRQPYTNWLGSLSETDKSVVRSVLEKLDLKELHNKACGAMSDGQLQRVMIGRALAQDTPLILLDEPTSHLDIYHKAYIFKLLRTIAHDTKKTILFSSHEIDLAIQLCDKILVLQPREAGFGDPCSLIEQGSFQSLFPSDLIKFDSRSGSFRIKK